MKSECGGFYMHLDGELDIRSTYCALNTAHLLNILDDKLLKNVDTFLQSCQTFEGGIGAEPFNEAHGGYTFCGLAVAILANCAHVLNLPALLVLFRSFLPFSRFLIFLRSDGLFPNKKDTRADFKVGPINWSILVIRFGRVLSSQCCMVYCKNQLSRNKHHHRTVVLPLMTV